MSVCPYLLTDMFLLYNMAPDRFIDIFGESTIKDVFEVG